MSTSALPSSGLLNCRAPNQLHSPVLHNAPIQNPAPSLTAHTQKFSLSLKYKREAFATSNVHLNTHVEYSGTDPRADRYPISNASISRPESLTSQPSS